MGLVLVQRLVPPDLRGEHNNVAGFIYAVLGVSYAVLLAFVVIAVWQDYKTAQSNVESEANELAGVYFLASQLPEPERTRVQGAGSRPDVRQGRGGAGVADDGGGPDEPARGLPPSPAQVEAAGVRSQHQRRAGALRTWADASARYGRRQEVTAAGGQGGHTRSAVGSPRGRRGDHGVLHLPIRA